MSLNITDDGKGQSAYWMFYYHNIKLSTYIDISLNNYRFHTNLTK